MMAWAKTKNQSNQSTQKPSKRPKKRAPINQTFMQHIGELRKRLFWTALFGLGIGTVVTMYYGEMLHIVLAPYGDQKLIYLTVGGGFSFIFSVTVYMALIGLMPVLLYQLYAFMKPAIPRSAQIASVKVGIFAFLLMMAGVAFGYFVAIPRGLEFMTTFADDVVESVLTADSYLNFVFGYALGLGLLFELPLVLMLWHWISPLSVKKLMMTERYIILVAFILAAIISPTPDPYNQLIIAIPIILIYQLGVIGVWVSIRRQNKRAKKAAKSTSSPPAAGPPSPPTLPPSRLIPEPVPVVAATAPRPALRPAKTAKTMSIDGFRVKQGAKKPAPAMSTLRHHVTPTVSRPLIAASTASAKRPADRGRVVVPRRTPGLISDFGPIRRSAIDIVR